MLRSCLNDSLEVGMASLLPCFWIYREVGNYIEKHADKSNPYYRWIETYASEGFSNTVDEAIGIFDMLADNTTENMRQRMLDAFYKSACLEWHFWNDAYQIKSFDDVRS